MHFTSRDSAVSAHEVLLSTVARTNAKFECIDCRIITETENPVHILYTEQWSSEAAFVSHARSDEFKYVLTALDLSSEMPEVKVERLYTDNGLECFEQILQQAAESTRMDEMAD